jgi:DnaK suppressor protein
MSEALKRLSSEETAELKDAFIRRKKALWQEIRGVLEREVREGHQDLMQTIKDEGDLALAELRESTLFRLIEMKADELENIERSLMRIEDGEYGRCIDCGESINPARLEIMPHATRCRDCSQRWEKKGSRGK